MSLNGKLFNKDEIMRYIILSFNAKLGKRLLQRSSKHGFVQCGKILNVFETINIQKRMAGTYSILLKIHVTSILH